MTNKTFKSVDFVSDMDDIRLDKNSLVIISHVLYEPATVRKVTRFLSRCPKGTFVLFRGASPNSFLYQRVLHVPMRLTGRISVIYGILYGLDQ